MPLAEMFAIYAIKKSDINYRSILFWTPNPSPPPPSISALDNFIFPPWWLTGWTSNNFVYSYQLKGLTYSLEELISLLHLKKENWGIYCQIRSSLWCFWSWRFLPDWRWRLVLRLALSSHSWPSISWSRSRLWAPGVLPAASGQWSDTCCLSRGIRLCDWELG